MGENQVWLVVVGKLRGSIGGWDLSHKSFSEKTAFEQTREKWRQPRQFVRADHAGRQEGRL